MITDSNQARLAKMIGRRVQEGRGGKVGYRFHLQSVGTGLWQKLMICDWKRE